jgi:hypothetical protein
VAILSIIHRCTGIHPPPRASNDQHHRRSSRTSAGRTASSHLQPTTTAPSRGARASRCPAPVSSLPIRSVAVCRIVHSALTVACVVVYYVPDGWVPPNVSSLSIRSVAVCRIVHSALTVCVVLVCKYYHARFRHCLWVGDGDQPRRGADDPRQHAQNDAGRVAVGPQLPRRRANKRLELPLRRRYRRFRLPEAF